MPCGACTECGPRIKARDGGIPSPRKPKASYFDLKKSWTDIRLWPVSRDLLQKSEESVFSLMHVVLVEPEIPQNTGNIARLCALTESELHLVGKLGFSVNDYYLRRAGLDYWDCLKVSYQQSLEELPVGISGRLYYVSTKATRLYTHILYQREDYLVFGSETRGLPRELIDSNPESSIRIPMWGSKPRSHNLSNSAAIVLYEALRQIKNF